MFALPKAAEPLIGAFSVAFSRPTFQRVLVLLVGAILSWRRRTITAVLQTAGPLSRGHWSNFHRVLCRAVARARRPAPAPSPRGPCRLARPGVCRAARLRRPALRVAAVLSSTCLVGYALPVPCG